MLLVRELTLRNFRGFAQLKGLRLAPLTFLVGPNSSGKSSIADALLFMVQSGLLSLRATNPIWTGPLVDLGSFEDTVFRHENHRALEVGVRVEGLMLPSYFYRHEPRHPPRTVDVSANVKTARDAPEGRLTRLTVSEPETKLRAELVRRRGRYESFQAQAGGKHVVYDARRPWTGPSDSLEAVLAKQRRAGSLRGRPRHLAMIIGHGELDRFARTTQRVASGRDAPQRTYERTGASVGSRDRRRLVGVDASALEGKGRSAGRALSTALAKGLSAIGVASEINAVRLSNYHTAVKLKDSRTGVVSNLADVGYGASQVIPVIEGCADAGPGPLFVEQPEIHLHPKAQGDLAQLLCVASLKRQMIVETHSEHMVNRARLLVAEGVLKPSDVVIQFVDRDKNGSRVTLIDLDAAGNFSRNWPGGFFDERYHETMRIADAQAGRATK
jgi:predicted ATPase